MQEVCVTNTNNDWNLKKKPHAHNVRPVSPNVRPRIPNVGPNTQNGITTRAGYSLCLVLEGRVCIGKGSRGIWDQALQQELGTFPRPTRRVGKLEMFKINNSIVGGLKGHSAFVAPFTTRLACLVPQIIRLAPGRFVAEIELTNMEPRKLIHVHSLGEPDPGLKPFYQ